MRNILMLLLLLVSVEAYSINSELEQLLLRLDSVLACSDKYVAEKEARIDELRKRKSSALKPEERLWLNKMFYDEYYVYNVDSAMVYVTDNISISRELGRKDWEQEWLLNKVFLLAATGLLSEAEGVIEDIDIKSLNKDLMFRYYDSKIYLYSHLGQYIGERPELTRAYYEREAELKRDAQVFITPDNPSYYSFYASLHKDYPRSAFGDSIKVKLQKIVEKSRLSSRTDAINSYHLAIMFYNEGDEYNYIKYLLYSAIADIKISNRDIASLEEFSYVLYQQGDIDRAYTYANYCLQIGQAYHNRIRVSGILKTLDKIHKVYQERNRIQQARLFGSLVSVSVLTLVLLIAIFYIYRQMKRISEARLNLNKANALLNEHVQQLSEAHRQLKEANINLKALNQELSDTNNQLRESNYIKEEYIGYVFAICSSYISKLDDFRKNVNRKLKAGQVEDLRKSTETSIVKSELKEFYHNFDAIFLHVYPDFVNDFNTLLRPEERIVLKEGELLNTDLRIYALVRLGINDSIKIADFLHCSPQTVYNNRLKMRNRASIPKETFADTVKSLGKIQQ